MQARGQESHEDYHEATQASLSELKQINSRLEDELEFLRMYHRTMEGVTGQRSEEEKQILGKLHSSRENR